MPAEAPQAPGAAAGGDPPSLDTWTQSETPPQEDRQNRENHLQRLTKLRKSSYQIASWAQPEYLGPREEFLRKKSNDQLKCGCYLGFRQATAGPDQSPKLHRAFLCKHAWTCPFCAARRGALLVQQAVPKCLTIRREVADARFSMFTATVPHGDDWQGSHKRLCEARDKFRHRWSKQKKRGGPLANLVAALWQDEFKRGRDGLPHVHTHAVFISRGPLNWSAIIAIWTECVGEQAVSRFSEFEADKKARQYAAKGKPLTEEEYAANLRGGLAEVIKYPAKFDNNNPADVWEIADAMSGKRTKILRTWGELRGLEVPEDLMDEPLDWDEVPFVEWYAAYQRGRYVTLSGNHHQQAAKALAVAQGEGAGSPRVEPSGGAVHEDDYEAVVRERGQEIISVRYDRSRYRRSPDRHDSHSSDSRQGIQEGLETSTDQTEAGQECEGRRGRLQQPDGVSLKQPDAEAHQPPPTASLSQPQASPKRRRSTGNSAQSQPSLPGLEDARDGPASSSSQCLPDASGLPF